MGAITGIHHICIQTPEIEKSIGFYCELLGFRLLRRETCTFGQYAMLRLGSSNLELIEPKNPTKTSFGNTGAIAHIGLSCEDIDAVFANLRLKGVKFTADAVGDYDEPMGGLRAASFFGPSGEAINLYAFKHEF